MDTLKHELQQSYGTQVARIKRRSSDDIRTVWLQRRTLDGTWDHKGFAGAALSRANGSLLANR